MSAEFVLREHKDGTFGFIFQTETGQVLLTSTSYCDADTALRRLRSAWQMARKDRNYELRPADEGGFYFVVKNRSKEVLAHSPLYPDPQSLRQGITLTRGCSHDARIENPFKLTARQRACRTPRTALTCPTCGSAMILRLARGGAHRGEKFWGCSKYPRCRGFLEYLRPARPEPQPF
jgi:uncharacterized protein YegP (UPF0339 family)